MEAKESLPPDFITREEAATILDRICEYVDISGNDAYDFPLS